MQEKYGKIEFIKTHQIKIGLISIGKQGKVGFIY